MEIRQNNSNVNKKYKMKVTRRVSCMSGVPGRSQSTQLSRNFKVASWYYHVLCAFLSTFWINWLLFKNKKNYTKVMHSVFPKMHSLNLTREWKAQINQKPSSNSLYKVDFFEIWDDHSSDSEHSRHKIFSETSGNTFPAILFRIPEK